MNIIIIFYEARKECAEMESGRLMDHFAVSSRLSSIKYTQHVKQDHFLMKLKFFFSTADLCSSPPLHPIPIPVALPLSFCIIQLLLCFHWMNFYFFFVLFMLLSNDDRRIIKKCFQCFLLLRLLLCGPNESKANRWEKNFIRRPVFLDHVFFFFLIKNSSFATQDFYVRIAKR